MSNRSILPIQWKVIVLVEIPFSYMNFNKFPHTIEALYYRKVKQSTVNVINFDWVSCESVFIIELLKIKCKHVIRSARIIDVRLFMQIFYLIGMVIASIHCIIISCIISWKRASKNACCRKMIDRFSEYTKIFAAIYRILLYRCNTGMHPSKSFSLSLS